MTSNDALRSNPGRLRVSAEADELLASLDLVDFNMSENTGLLKIVWA